MDTYEAFDRIKTINDAMDELRAVRDGIIREAREAIHMDYDKFNHAYNEYHKNKGK
jgi:hypothetical protein